MISPHLEGLERIEYLTADEIITIHNVMIKDHGGEPGIFPGRKGNIESMLSRMCDGFYSPDPPFKTLIEKVAFQFQSILQYHYFIDGTKRTGIMSSVAFLLKNDAVFYPISDKEAIDFAKRVADDLSQNEDKELAFDEIKKWFTDRVFSIRDSNKVISFLNSKGITFKCPRCRGENTSLSKPYCPDCGLQLIKISNDIDAIVVKKQVIFERQTTQDIRALSNQKTQFHWSITEIK